MTNKELIEELKQLPPDMEVWLIDDDCGNFYPIYQTKVINVGEQITYTQDPLKAVDTGKEIMGIVLGGDNDILS